jgi:hypothetical protein
MNQVLHLPTPKANISPVGLQFTGDLTLDEWKSLAPSLGQAARSVAFVIGGWLVCGDSLFGTDGPPNKRVASALYEFATKHPRHRHHDVAPAEPASTSHLRERPPQPRGRLRRRPGKIPGGHPWPAGTW